MLRFPPPFECLAGVPMSLMRAALVMLLIVVNTLLHAVPLLLVALCKAVLPFDGLRRAILQEDVGALSQAPGVGKRSAQKLILELRPKLADAEAEVVQGSGQASVRQALEQLGYRGDEINEVVDDLDPEESLESQIRTALKILGQARRA